MKDDLHALHGPVAVLRRAAAHAARVVGRDPADHAVVDGGGVRPDLAPEGGEESVRLGADDPGLEGDPLPPIEDPVIPPPPREDGEDGVGHRLARQARAGGPERHGDRMAVRGLQKEGDLLRGSHLDDDFRDQAIETGVGTVCQCTERVTENAVRRDFSRDVVEIRPIFLRKSLVIPAPFAFDMLAVLPNGLLVGPLYHADSLCQGLFTACRAGGATRRKAPRSGIGSRSPRGGAGSRARSPTAGRPPSRHRPRGGGRKPGREAA